MGVYLEFEGDLGFDYIGAVLLGIPEQLDANLLPKALRQGARKLRDNIKAKARIAFNSIHYIEQGRTEGLYTSIKDRPPTPEYWPDPYVRVGASYARQAYLVEYGHAGAKPAPPHPFVIPAILEGETEVLEKVTSYMQQRWVDQCKRPAMEKARRLTKGNATTGKVTYGYTTFRGKRGYRTPAGKFFPFAGE